MKKHIAVLAGDGIGPEITDAAIAVLKKIAEKKRYGKKNDPFPDRTSGHRNC